MIDPKFLESTVGVTSAAMDGRESVPASPAPSSPMNAEETPK